ncbi:MAG: PaaX family transcriptional regulator C-terminal domain-containing protein [Pseudomonadota bacterium]
MSKKCKIVSRLVDDLHEAGKLRVWSIIVTVFGDAIVPRGGTISLTALQNILGNLGIEPNAVRTAMSRLARDGWVERRKFGRQSFYLLAKGGMASFESATARIYAAEPPHWDGRFELVLTGPDNLKSRMMFERQMRRRGFGSPLNGLFIRPLTAEHNKGQIENTFAVMEACNLVSDSLPEFIEQSWQIEGLNTRYQHLIDKYKGVLEHAKEGKLSQPEDCLAVRILLIHDWRRLILQDADLPLELKPREWNGEKARAIVAELYHRILENSECVLDACLAAPGENLPQADRALGNRFR